MADDLSEKLRTAIEAMIGTVREMIDASKLLRNRVTQNDEVLLVIEGQQRAIADRLDTMERRLQLLERRN